VKKGPEGNDSLERGSGGARASEAGTGAGGKKSVAELHDFHDFLGQTAKHESNAKSLILRNQPYEVAFGHSAALRYG